ncbi:MAG: hypothetical protein GXP22_00990 [Gammaproteobacteria bacterium]|nr:hypothetical protein [Gammaproteobacteria bacterium]
MMKNCLNCHFLCDSYREENSGCELKFSLKQELRESLKNNPVGYDRGWHTLQCHMGVWDEGVSPVAKGEDTILFSQDRGYSCFFIPYRKSMLFPAAIEIQKREEENRWLKRTSTYTVIGLWLAGIGLILNALVAIYQAIKC